MQLSREVALLREVNTNVVHAQGELHPFSCELPLPKASKKSKKQLQCARIDARMNEADPLSFCELHQRVAAFLELEFETMEAYTGLRCREAVRQLPEQFDALLQRADADAQVIIEPLRQGWYSLGTALKESSRIMDVLHAKRGVLRRGLEYPFQDLLDWLLLAALLDEQVTRDDVISFARDLGPCNRATVEHVLASRVFPHSEDLAAQLYLALRAARPVLDDASCITGYYFSAALDGFIEEDEKTVGTTLFQSSDISQAMRAKLCEWLYETYVGTAVHRPLREETYFLGAALLDRFLAVRTVTRNSFLLCGCAAVLLASKNEEIYSPAVPRVVKDAQNAFTDGSLVEMERQIACGLNFSLGYPTVSNIANTLLVEQDPPASPSQRSILSYLLVALSIHTYHGQHSQALLAAAAFHLSRMVCGVPTGCPSAPVQAMMPCVWAAATALSDSGSRIYAMFSQRRFHEASLLVKTYSAVCASHGELLF